MSSPNPANQQPAEENPKTSAPSTPPQVAADSLSDEAEEQGEKQLPPHTEGAGTRYPNYNFDKPDLDKLAYTQ